MDIPFICNQSVRVNFFNYMSFFSLRRQYLNYFAIIKIKSKDFSFLNYHFFNRISYIQNF